MYILVKVIDTVAIEASKRGQLGLPQQDSWAATTSSNWMDVQLWEYKQVLELSAWSLWVHDLVSGLLNSGFARQLARAKRSLSLRPRSKGQQYKQMRRIWTATYFRSYTQYDKICLSIVCFFVNLICKICD